MDSESDFQEFLGYYLNKYAYESITFLELRIAFNEFVNQKYGAQDQTKAQNIINSIDWVAWV